MTKNKIVKRDTNEIINYLNLNLSNQDDFLFALRDIVTSTIGFIELSKRTGLGREGLYKSIAPLGDPYFSTALKVIKALEIDLHFVSQKNNFSETIIPANIRLNSLAESHPELCKNWHPTLNDKLTPQDVTISSRKRIWWKCQNDDNHLWESTIGANKKCPFCRMKI